MESDRDPTMYLNKEKLAVYSPASKASREVANLTERKNLLTPYMSKNLSICPSVTNFDPNYLRTG